jgi:hypothetical protein
VQRRRSGLVAVAVAATLFVAGAAADPQRSPSEDLETAKGLYREGHFGQAIVKLQALLDELPLLRDVALRRMALADAYLHLALSYVALDQRDAAREALRGMRKADPARTLSPDVYAPKVRSLYDEVLAESLAPSAGERQEPAPARRGGRVPLLLGAGAAVAGGGVLLATRRGEAGPGGFQPSTSTSSGNARIAWMGATPAPGRTVPMRLTGCPRGFSGQCTSSLNLVFSVTSDVDVSDVFLKVELLRGSVPCLHGSSYDGFNTPNLRAGVAAQMVVTSLSVGACPTPIDTTSLSAFLHSASGAGSTLAVQGFGGGYRFTP